MEFSVMSRMRIEKYSRQAHQETSAVISIYSLDRYPAKIARIPENRIKDILYVAFDDVENGPGAITEEDAKKIIQFTDKVVNRRYERLIVQCDAGISRSSGVCAAIEKYLGYLKNHDMPDWEVPNMLAKYYITTTALDMARQSGK